MTCLTRTQRHICVGVGDTWTMTTAQNNNAEFVSRVFEDGWNRSRFDFLEGATASTIPFHYNGTTEDATPDTLPGLVETWRRAFPDLTMMIRQVVAEGDLVAVALTFRGTHLGPWAGNDASGAKVSVEEMMMFRFENGLLVEMWEVFDNEGLLSQINASTTRP